MRFRVDVQTEVAGYILLMRWMVRGKYRILVIYGIPLKEYEHISNNTHLNWRLKAFKVELQEHLVEEHSYVYRW